MHKQKLSILVYEKIYSEILSGKYAFQDQLPSIAKLCEQYQVGRNTMRTVLQRLENELMIVQEKGTNAKVIFNIDNANDHEVFLQNLMGKADTIKHVFTTMEWLLPDITLYCIKNSSAEQMNQLKSLIQDLKYKDMSNDRLFLDALIDVYSYVLSMVDNAFINDLFLSFTRYVYVGVPETMINSARLEKIEKYTHKMIASMFEFVMLGNTAMIKRSLQLLLALFAKSTQRLYKRYEHETRNFKVIPFQWSCKRSRDYLYASIVSDIIKDIENGAYANHDHLLSIEMLAKKYHVSAKTIRKALDILKEYHIVETRNGVGSFVVNNIQVNEQKTDQTAVNEYIHDYYQALELLYISLKGLQKEYYKMIDHQELNELIIDLELANDWDFYPLLQRIFHMNPCLQNIYDELLKSLEWRFYVYYVTPIATFDFDIKTNRTALLQALRNQNYKSASKVLETVLSFKLQHAKQSYHKVNKTK